MGQNISGVQIPGQFQEPSSLGCGEFPNSFQQRGRASVRGPAAGVCGHQQKHWYKTNHNGHVRGTSNKMTNLGLSIWSFFFRTWFPDPGHGTGYPTVFFDIPKWHVLVGEKVSKGWLQSILVWIALFMGFCSFANPQTQLISNFKSSWSIWMPTIFRGVPHSRFAKRNMMGKLKSNVLGHHSFSANCCTSVTSVARNRAEGLVEICQAYRRCHGKFHQEALSSAGLGNLEVFQDALRVSLKTMHNMHN